MTDAVSHRGPDGFGAFVMGPIALGHRRLAIIDLSAAAHQPMRSRSGRFVLTFNGMIYNYLDLRTELEALGHTFRSNSDTEVLLEAFAEWGTAAIPRLNGMFAFAIWDEQQSRLTLARDRYGIKPLYVSNTGREFVFGSEIKALLAHPEVGANLDQEGLIEYFTFQNFFTDRTLFSKVSILPPASILSVDIDGNVQRDAYWDYSFQEPEQPLRDEEYLEELDRLFQQAVTRQLASDVEVGTYLSGGMDSGSIAAVATRSFPDLKSFTIGFEAHSSMGMEAGFEDERLAAEFMAYKFGTEHYEMVLKAGDMVRVLPDLVRHIEEPRVGQSYPNYYAAKLASRFVKVALSGAGGDELFGGYPWRYYRAVVNDSFRDYVDKYYLFWQRLIPNRQIKSVFSPIWKNVSHVQTRDIFESVFRSHPERLSRPEDYINESLYFEAKTFLHGLLVVEDKLSMAHGLETRVPFLDNDLVDFAMSVPIHLKLGNLAEVVRLDENDPGPKTKKFFQRTNDGKLILRKCMERHVPREVTEREKQGFSGPDEQWFRGASLDYVRKRLFNKTARIYEFMDYDAVTNTLNEHISGQHNRRLFVWSVLNFEQWCDEFLT